MFKGFSSIFYKEVIQVSRDPLTLLLMLVVPMVQLIIFGYAINTDIRNIRTAVHNLDPGEESRELIDAFRNTDYFSVVLWVHSDEQLNDAIVRGQAKVGVKIPPDYSQRVYGSGGLMPRFLSHRRGTGAASPMYVYRYEMMRGLLEKFRRQGFRP